MLRPAIVILLASVVLTAAGPQARAQAAAHPAAAIHPSWVDDTLEPDGRAHIERIAIAAGSPDVVVLDRGLYAGLRIGTPCVVERNGATIGELIVVASDDGRAAALVTAQAKNLTLQAGDQVRLKIISRVV